ncbi:MAG: serine acetyltransferase [Cyanobacteria bacterium J06639_14]
MQNYKYTFSELLSDIKTDISVKTSSYLWSFYYFLFSPQIKVVFYYRLSHWLFVNNFCRLAYVIKCFQAKYGCYISEKSIIGKRFSLPHPVGIVIGDGVVIEDNVSIWQNVTLGSHGKRDTQPGYPYIERDVRIFVGAVLIGRIKVGEKATIGANTVVLSDVPPNSIAVGTPYKGYQ